MGFWFSLATHGLITQFLLLRVGFGLLVLAVIVPSNLILR
jgi:hypothetical protein